MNNSSFRNFAWALLGYNVLIILWGAFVRVSKSGDGCGSHWPTCNGEPFHIPDNFATMVELIHRLTSGLDLPLVILLVVWAFRLFPKRHAVRGAAAASLFFVLTEALFGAVLVRYGLVVDNDSIARAIVLSAHLVNTFLLLGALTLTAWWGGGEPVMSWKGQGALGWLFCIALASTLLVGVSGAIAALGDTLFPAESLQEALLQDLSPTAHILIRLRVLHPFLAVGTGFFLVYLAGRAARLRPAPVVRRLALFAVLMFAVQLTAGVVNLLLLAPVAMQIFHLFLADVVWVNLVLMTATALATQHVPAMRHAPRRVPEAAGEKAEAVA